MAANRWPQPIKYLDVAGEPEREHQFETPSYEVILRPIWQSPDFLLVDTLTTTLYFLKWMSIRPFYCISSFLFPHKRDLFRPLWSPCVTHFVWTLRMNSYSHVSLITVNLDQLSGTWCELFVHVHYFFLLTLYMLF